MMAILFEGITEVIKEVTLALSPVIILFALAQIFVLKLPRKKLLRIFQGSVYAFIGLVLFLQGVNIGFMPVGEMMGSILASFAYNWILIPLGFVLGFAAVMAEPAVQVLTEEIERVSGGSINKRAILIALCLGVGVIGRSGHGENINRDSAVVFRFAGLCLSVYFKQICQPQFYRHSF